MKKVFLFLAVATFMANASYAIAPCVVVSKCGGLKGLYDYVGEVHDEKTNTHKLTCQDPGTKQCLWVTQPPEEMGATFGEIDEYVSDKVELGVFFGEESFGEGTVKWSATSPNCYTYTFK